MLVARQGCATPGFVDWAPLSGDPYGRYVGMQKRVRKGGLANPSAGRKNWTLSRGDQAGFFWVADHFCEGLA